MTTTFSVDSPHVAGLRVVVSRLESLERQARRIDAERARLYAAAFDIAAAESDRAHASVPSGRAAELAHRSVRAELALALHLSEPTVEQHLSQARALTCDYPEIFEALASGAISERHTRIILDAGTIIGDGDAPDVLARRASYETEVLAVAVHETPNRLRPIARRIAEQYARRTLDERHEQACTRRRVVVVDREDGMSDLTAHLPTVLAHAIHDRLTSMSRQITRTETVAPVADGALQRTRDQTRADLFGDLLMNGSPESAAGLGEVQARVQVIVTDETLFAESLRMDDESCIDSSGLPVIGFDDIDYGAPTSLAPAELPGVGPIDTETARRLAATTASWELIRQDPRTGAVLSVDRYRPSEAMRRLLAVRDRRCRFPGCRAPVHRCDLDHTIDAAQGGPTATTNLAHLCRGHHTLKHHGGWTVKQLGDGVLQWRSPAGRVHADRPDRPPGASRSPVPSRVRFEPAPF